ncbi:ROK family protein [Bacillus sp. USDA818B3_A]|uniref:ROK family protein n=1 Tax=Bacillus sp. USDA818B3_A TaxID=2698834 RepID=UPI00136AF47B|nr:ROK family protein [Bacillus sp. USDA818B3_A]
MKYYAVFDVGGSTIKYALMNENGNFISKSYTPTPNSLAVFVNTINWVIENYRDDYLLDGIAISIPGVVDIKKGTIGGISAIPYIHGPNIKHLLQDKTNLRVELENDGNCAGLAEGWLGNAKDVQDYVCIVLGSGIGGSIFLDKKLRHGTNLFAGEFGYMIMEDYLEQPHGVSWSSLASTKALVNQVAKRKKRGSSIFDGKKIFQMADNGDRKVKNEIEKFTKRLAVGIYNIQHVIDPEKFLIGGAITERYDLIDKINEKLLGMKGRIDIRVEKCKFENDSNLIGALYNFRQQENSINILY